MMQSIRFLVRSRRNEKGFMSITFAVMLVALIGFAGLAVDAGYMQWNKRRVQMAADAAAMGALREMQRQATTMSFADMYLLLAVVTAASLLLVPLIARPKGAADIAAH